MKRLGPRRLPRKEACFRIKKSCFIKQPTFLTIRETTLTAISTFVWRAVWPDVGVKSGPILPKFGPKISHNSFCLKVTFLKIVRKSCQIFGNIVIIFLSRTLKIAQSGHTLDCAVILWIKRTKGAKVSW